MTVRQLLAQAVSLTLQELARSAVDDIQRNWLDEAMSILVTASKAKKATADSASASAQPPPQAQVQTPQPAQEEQQKKAVPAMRLLKREPVPIESPHPERRPSVSKHPAALDTPSPPLTGRSSSSTISQQRRKEAEQLSDEDIRDGEDDVDVDDAMDVDDASELDIDVEGNTSDMETSVPVPFKKRKSHKR